MDYGERALVQPVQVLGVGPVAAGGEYWVGVRIENGYEDVVTLALTAGQARELVVALADAATQIESWHGSPPGEFN